MCTCIYTYYPFTEPISFDVCALFFDVLSHLLSLWTSRILTALHCTGIYITLYWDIYIVYIVLGYMVHYITLYLGYGYVSVSTGI